MFFSRAQAMAFCQLREEGNSRRSAALPVVYSHTRQTHESSVGSTLTWSKMSNSRPLSRSDLATWSSSSAAGAVSGLFELPIRDRRCERAADARPS